MDPKRIEVYRQLGDRLVEYTLKQGPDEAKRVYTQLRTRRRYNDLRTMLMQKQEDMQRTGAGEVLMSYDEFILAFEPPGEKYRQWKIARDLIAIRMMEKLHQHNIDMSELTVDVPTDDEEDEAE